MTASPGDSFHPDPRLGRPAAPVAPDLTGPFLRRDGLASGMTKHQLDGGRFRPVFGSVRVPGDLALTPLVTARAAVLVVPGGIVSHHSAARLWGGVVPDDGRTHLTVRTRGERRRPRGLTVHLGRTCVETVTRGGVRLTTPAQTFLDLACHLGLVDLVVLGDSLLATGHLTLDALHALVDRSGARGAARARRAAALVRDRVESPMETRVRLMLVLAGLPEPQVNLEIRGDGRTYRLDLAWPELRLAVEYDGRHHAEDTVQWGKDIGRREWLESGGWRLIVLRADDVYATPWATIGRIVEALRQRGYDKPLGSPPPEFVEHFPGRPSARGRRSA